MPMKVISADSEEQVKKQELDNYLHKAFKREVNKNLDPFNKTLPDTLSGPSSVVMARRGKSGKLETFCTSNEAEAKRFFSGESIKSITGEKHEK